MPRESVSVSRTVADADGREVEGVVVSRIDIGWDNVGTVQLGVTAPANELEAYRDGLYTENLDRSAINRLIRLLRKARDGSYGRDE
jgi:hypothetical protein